METMDMTLLSSFVAPPETDSLTTQCFGLPDLVGKLESIIKFRRRDDGILCLLWAAQSWLGPDILPAEFVAYLIFTGPKSSGKTTATKLMTDIAGGVFIAGGTEAAIRDILSTNPPALGIDEIDIRIRAVPNLEGILRTGSRWYA